MTRKACWQAAGTLLLVAGLTAAQAQCPKECGAKPDGKADGVCPAPLDYHGHLKLISIGKDPNCPACCTESQGCPGCAAAKAKNAEPGTVTLAIPQGLNYFLPFPPTELDLMCSGTANIVQVVDPLPAESSEYVLEARVVEQRPGEPSRAVHEAITPINQSASISFRDGVPHPQPTGKAGERPDGTMDVRVTPLDSGKLLLDVSVQKNRVVRSGQTGTVVLTQRLAAVQEVRPGGTYKLPLEQDDHGGDRAWVELRVRPSAATRAAVMPEKAVATTELDRIFFWLPGPGLPSAPMIPLTPPPAAPEGYTVAPYPSPMPCPGAAEPLTPCRAVEPFRPERASASVFRAIKEDGHAALEMIQGANTHLTCSSMTWKTPGCAAVKLAAAGERVAVTGLQMKGYANRVIADGKGNLVLEGRARLTCQRDGAPRHVTNGDKIILNLADGRMTVENSSGQSER